MDAAGTMTLRGATHPEPGLVPAGILAVLMHVVFLVFLVFGFSWKTAPPESMAVDLWSSLPEPEPPAQAQVEPRVETEVEKAPAPPPPVKPEIALKEKPIKPDKPKPVEPKPQAVQKDPKTVQAEARREVERMQREQEAINRQLQARQAAAQARLVDEYRGKIRDAIKHRIVTPPDLPGNPVAEFNVILLPGGDILEVKLKKSSGFAVFDSAVERAIRQLKRLPLPPDATLFGQFRELDIPVHYREKQ